MAGGEPRAVGFDFGGRRTTVTLGQLQKWYATPVRRNCLNTMPQRIESGVFK